MSAYTEKEMDDVWRKGIILDGWNPDEYRLDAAGAMMVRSHRGNDDKYDWEIDHVFPKHKLEAEGISEEEWNDLANLRPFNAKNNASKSDEYPIYKRALVFDEGKRMNVESEVEKVVNENVQAAINKCYGFKFEIIEGDHSLN